MEIRSATIEDLAAIRAEQPAFWGERDLAHLHHPLLVHEFGLLALAIDGEDGRIAGYLFGVLGLERSGYIHLVGVREGRRREGLGRALYGEFEARARALGAVTLRSFTQPANTRSIAFHEALGFAAAEAADYAAPGEMRVVFSKPLAMSGAGMSN